MPLRVHALPAAMMAGGLALSICFVLDESPPPAPPAPADRPTSAIKCTSLIVGKDATADGSVLLAHNEDLGDHSVQHYITVPHAAHSPGDVVTLYSGVEVPQVEETYGYMASTIFDLHYIPGDVTSGINEHQVSVANNLAYQRSAISPCPITGRIIWTEFTKLALQRASTAREAVDVIGGLAQTYKLGLDTGTMFAVADPEEGWWIEVAQEGQWVAQRVADDEAVVRANAYRIGVVDFADPDRFLFSDDLVSYAASRGWYSGGDFHFSDTYGDFTVSPAPWNTHREDRLADLLAAEIPAVEPAHVMAMLRDHYVGTAWDPTNGYVDGSPHQTYEYCVCDLTTEISVVCQSRGWLPAEIGAVCWRAMATPCSSVYVPWYYGHTAVPAAYETGTPVAMSGSAYWAFRELSEVVDPQYGDVIADLSGFWGDFEADERDQQSANEDAAVQLYVSDPASAVDHLEGETEAWAVQAYDYAVALLANGLDVDALGDDDDSAVTDDDDSSTGDDDTATPDDDTETPDDDTETPDDDDSDPPAPSGDDDGEAGCSCGTVGRQIPPGGLFALVLTWVGSRTRRRARVSSPRPG